MDFHPSKVPLVKTFDISDEKSASEAAEEMVRSGFREKGGYKVLMPKEKRLAKRIGYTITTTVTYGLKKTGQERDVQYWTYHEDAEHYAIVMASSKVVEGLA